MLSLWQRVFDRFERAAIVAPGGVAALVVVGIGLVGLVDYATGVEYRTYPLYFFPISLAAWFLGRRVTAITALVSALAWFASNYLAGMRYSSGWVWGVNIAMQMAAFNLVGHLIASVRVSLARELQRSRTDPLTLLLNRRAFYEMAQQVLELGRRYRHAVTIAYLDLDNFKAVNDTRGHDAGDRTLQQVALALRTSVRAGDLCARVGGDEFVVLLPETAASGAEALLERLRGRLVQELRGGECAATVSIGAVSFDSPPAEVEELVRQADAAMYAAKAAGKNQLNLTTPLLQPARA